MSRIPRMTKVLQQQFKPTHLVLIDDSARHAHHSAMKGVDTVEESHLKLEIAADSLSGMPKVKAHQAIYRALDAEFRSGLHALNISIAKD